ncbi:unnamed protein product [Ilex paraguariensis]|uniref:FAS1 domain-containing protein n=1 Tax=Ilex paraguariensis TaxID=185542 RepID=A0ABC8V5Y4_9AQUA
MAFSSISHFAPLTILCFLTFSSHHIPIEAINVTNLLSSNPDLSEFTNLLTSTAVAADLTQRSSVTLLVVPNTYLRSSDLTHHPYNPSSANLADVLSYHVLLEYLSWYDLRRVPPNGKLVATLFQTTGRATNNFGSVNITRNPTTNAITIFSPTTNATLLSLIKSIPYNITIFSVNSLLVPYGFDLMASETRPPLGLNITKALIDGHNFNVAASMLTASGVVEKFEADEGGAGITMFVPTDDAFSDLPATVGFPSLSADNKTVVLKFHVLHSYYPLGSLQSIVNPVQPTLATEDNGAGSYTLNISRVNGSLAIDTGIVQASVTQTVIDQNPVAIFGISRVLLPSEIFGKNPITVDAPSDNGVMGNAQPPENSPSSPPGFHEDKRSEAARNGVWQAILVLWCIGLYVLVSLSH